MGKLFFGQPVTNNLRTYDNTQKITTGQGDWLPTRFFLF